MLPPSSLPAPTPHTLTPMQASASPVRFDAFQATLHRGDAPGMGQALTNAMDGFGARAARMQASMRDLATRDTAAGRAPAVGDVQAPGALTAPGGGGIQAPMALMVDSFNFAIEASLVSRAATQFTGSISTLMKGQ